jgi:hypothetical protein
MGFLSALKQFYSNRMSSASGQKEKLVDSLTATPGLKAGYEQQKARYVNEAVTDAVKNTAGVERIVEYDGQLVQKIYPVYMDDHRPAHSLDFSANLYQPTKHFAGINFNTFYFNIAVIWSMTFFLFVTLYFDALKRFIKLLEGNRKYRRRDRQ